MDNAFVDQRDRKLLAAHIAAMPGIQHHRTIDNGGFTIVASQVLNVVPIQLDRILEAAVILSWDELMNETPPARIHVEYHADERALDNLKVWASTQRGHWNLVCEYVPQSGTTIPAELTFANGYESETLGQVLRLVIERHQMFVTGARLGGGVALVQVPLPAEADRRAAESVLRQALDEDAFAAMLPRKPSTSAA